MATKDPEVLCIRGKWGVGKTYAWKKYLVDAADKKKLGLDNYSYVSLFGLNSLEDLRYSIFENTVTADKLKTGPDLDTLGTLLDKGKNASRKARTMMELLSSVLKMPGVANTILKSAFLLVRNQIICIDDLERAGKGLEARDVLGLVSFLKEERKCKVVLLLNDKELSDKVEFDKQLEKVADVTLAFDLSPEEAVRIALSQDDPVAELLRPQIVRLGITNIRVIKKIERLANRLVGLLHGFDKVTIEQALATVALAGWSVHQPNVAPTLDFIRKFNLISSDGTVLSPPGEASVMRRAVASAGAESATTNGEGASQGASSNSIVPKCRTISIV
ncbi:hypothetical protein AB4Z34_29290 [Ensifer sp. 2YAB10]|uniref:hypothetical protein n=1 Tax=unclassified Ensifer TaxID=2633371 RepID=UPI003F8FA423